MIAKWLSMLYFHKNLSISSQSYSVFSLKDKEYQQRRLLDAFVQGAKIQFERYRDECLLLRGSIESLRAWDPDMSKPTSDRNRYLLQVVKVGLGKDRPLDNMFSFQYRTFSRFNSDMRKKHDEHVLKRMLPLPRWIEEKACSGDIDDLLSIKIAPLEFNYLRERTAELADYLNNGLPGK